MNKSKKRNKTNKTNKTKKIKTKKGGEYNPRTNFTNPNDELEYTNTTPGINNEYDKIGMSSSSSSNSKTYLVGAVAVAGLGIGGFFLFKK